MSSLSFQITDWASASTGWFYYWQINEALNIDDAKDKNIRRVVIHGLCKKGELLRVTRGMRSGFCLPPQPMNLLLK